MKKGLTEIVFILDKSGSMSGLESDTIGGFNATIQKQKEESGEALVSTVLFSNYSEVIHDRVLINNIKEMTRKDYFVGGCTALFDAIGDAIHHIKNVHKYIRDEDRPEKTIFIITTDGMENASRKYSILDINKMITNMKNKYQWEFIFLGANIDAAGMASNLGIGKHNAANYLADEEGTEKNYQAMNEAIHSYRKYGNIASDWKKQVEEDYNMRKKNS